jgi:aryl-alcohol dehydrogenase-like predicted oxidoreductase
MGPLEDGYIGGARLTTGGRSLMKKRKLGSNGPEISVIGYGAWEAGGSLWGPNPPDDQVIGAMQTALDTGVNWIDTAEVYGRGHSEELVGKAIAGREDVLVFTKVGPEGTGSGLHASGIRQAVGGSLRRLNREVIDLYQLHWPDDSIPLEETWGTMASLVDEGLVRYIGVSNFDRTRIEKCEAIRHVDSLQPHFSMLWRRVRDEGLLSFCKDNGTGTISYGPLGYGLLTGAITKDTKFSEDDWRSGSRGLLNYDRMFAPGKLEANLQIVDKLRPVADRLNVTLAQLALAWVLHQEGATGAIAGSRSPEHVAQNSGAGDVELTDKDLEEIEAILA